MKVVSAGQYYDQLTAEIPKASQRIIIAAMVISAGQQTDKLFSLLRDAVKRGVNVHILLDVWSKHALARDKGVTRKEFKQIIERTTLRLEDLKTLGAQISWVGTIGSNPFRGRCHIKVAIIDNTSYSFGGVNFYDEAFEHIDFMLRSEEQIQADVLHSHVENIARNTSLKDNEVVLSDTMSVLFDTGVPGKSVIYERACTLAANSKNIYYISQMCPSGRLAKLIHQTAHECYFNRPWRGSVFLTASLMMDMLRSGLRTKYRHEEYLHAKCILFVMKDGTKQLITGSHNFSWRGVAYGTKEIALHSSDVRLWDSIYAFMEREVR